MFKNRRQFDEPYYDKVAIQKALGEVHAELDSARSRFNPFKNGHEGYAVILEELDELWEAVRDKKFSQKDRYNEAKQVAAMAVRFMVDLGDGKDEN